MRIIGGKSRGRTIKALKGLGLRPTADRVREAIFNILEHGVEGPGINGSFVIDVFAGTGAMGLEALSRGAAGALFIDLDPAAIACCRKNAAATGQWRNAIFLKLDACKPPPPPLAANAPCAYAFFDPPYESGLLVLALARFAARGWIGKGSVCVAESAAREPFAPPIGFKLIDERVYGVAKASFMVME